MTISASPVPILKDNYAWLLKDSATGATAIGPVGAAANEHANRKQGDHASRGENTTLLQYGHRFSLSLMLVAIAVEPRAPGPRGPPNERWSTRLDIPDIA